MTTAAELPQRDLVDVRLVAAIELGGCAICAVRARAESAATVAVLDGERVMDVGFRAGLERTNSFCRRHVAELIVAERRATGILSSAILYEALLGRRLAAVREALRSRGRGRRKRLGDAAVRPPCVICTEGAAAVDVASQRLVDRTSDPAWASAIGEIPFCLDDLVALMALAGDSARFAPIAERQLARLKDLEQRLDAYAHNSSPERRHLMTDDERRAADEAARALGGADQHGMTGRAGQPPAAGDGPTSR
jgi:hypothetical protein